MAENRTYNAVVSGPAPFKVTLLYRHHEIAEQTVNTMAQAKAWARQRALAHANANHVEDDDPDTPTEGQARVLTFTV